MVNNGISQKKRIIYTKTIMNEIYADARAIIDRAIAANLPGAAVRRALQNRPFSGRIAALALGKAAWTMAQAAREELGDRIERGIVITKYGHSRGNIPGMKIIEAGHPVSDEASLRGAEKALALAETLGAGDELLLLVSGGGSALFEKPLDGLTLAGIADINSQLLASGAGIVEINTIRKRLSAVKGGRFALACAPARIFTVILSDVLGDRPDSIASGPAAADPSTAAEALEIVKKYRLNLSGPMRECLVRETPKRLDNVETAVIGSVRSLCTAAASAAAELGYAPQILCDSMNGEAREAGLLMAAIARQIHDGTGSAGPFSLRRPCAVILGGETVVRLQGGGKGGRNQELALAAAEGIAGIPNLTVFSVGSDGTDGPTDAAGGIVDGSTLAALTARGLKPRDILDRNDSYNGLKAVNGLVMTGPTGTNVNDLAAILAR
jgi:hydroxypyruvate reductase